MMCRCAQTQTLLSNFKLKVLYSLLYPVHLCGDEKLQFKLNRFRDIFNTIPEGLQRIVQMHPSIHLFGPR